MLFIMRGTSCSGKSTFIEQHFAKECVFSSDKFREMLCGDASSQRHNKRVFEILHEIIEFRISSRVEYTVYDATNLKIRDTSAVLELAKKYGCPVTIISIRPPSIGELLDRNNHRKELTGMDIPVHVIQNHYDRYFNCMSDYIKEAENNTLVKFVEIDQDYEVINEV